MTSYTEDDLRQALADEALSTPPATDVWPTLRRRVTVRRWQRAGLATGIAALVTAVLIVVVPRGDDTTKLTFAHGTPVTWTPNRPLSGAELQRAAGILRQRLDALGLSRAQISTQEGTIAMRGPKLSLAVGSGVVTRGVLQFRPVLALQPAGERRLAPADATASTLAKAEHAFADAACPTRSSGSDVSTPAADYVIACSDDGTTEYLLAPAALANADIAQADSTINEQTNEWLVDVTFTAAGANKWHSLTADVAGKPDFGSCGPPSGCNGLAMVLDGSVVSAPRVQDPNGIRGNQTQIAGAFTRESAQILAAVLGSPPLPTGFTSSRG